MIIPPTECFYMIQVQGEAAEVVASTLSLGAMSDIREAVLVSEDYTNDIQATVCLDNMIAAVKQQLVESEVIESSEFNPLFKPSTHDELDEVLDGDDKAESSFRFIGMHGNPFMLKSTRLLHGEEEILVGQVSCRPFDLPSYTDILAGQAAVRPN